MDKSILNIIEKRHSTRKFTNEIIPNDLINKIIKAGALAPTACNKQLIKFLILKNDDPIKMQISKLLGIPAQFAPVVILIIEDTSLDLDPSTKQESYENIGFVAQNMWLMATSLGLGAYFVGGIAHIRDTTAKILNLDPRLEVCGAFCLGYPEISLTSKTKMKKNIGEYIANTKEDLVPEFPTSINPKDWSLNQIADYRMRISQYAHSTEFYGLIDYRYYVPLDYFSHIYNKKKKEITNFPKVLDLFSFRGEFLEGIVRRVGADSVYFTEFSPLLRRYCKERLQDVDITDLPEEIGTKIESSQKFRLIVDNGYMDIITCFYRLEMLPNWQDALKEAYRVLQNNGDLILALHISSLFDIIRNKRYKTISKSPYWNKGPFSSINWHEFMNVTSELGFKVIKEENIEMPHFSAKRERFDIKPKLEEMAKKRILNLKIVHLRRL